MPTARSCGARAAKAFGIPFTLSTMSICSHRGHGRGHRPPPLLVPALRDARPRLHRAPDRPRQGGQLLGPACSRWTCRSWASATRTSRTACRAPPKPTHRQPHQPGDQAALVPGHAGHASAAASATSWATSRAWRTWRSLVGVDGQAVRPGARTGATWSGSRSAGAAG